jgi:hypothetical protein
MLKRDLVGSVGDVVKEWKPPESRRHGPGILFNRTGRHDRAERGNPTKRRNHTKRRNRTKRRNHTKRRTCRDMVEAVMYQRISAGTSEALGVEGR